MTVKKFDFNGYDVKFENMLFLKLFDDLEFRSTVMPMLELRFFTPPTGIFPYDLIFKYFQKFYLEDTKKITPTQVIHAIQENEDYIEPDDIELIKKTFTEIGELYDDPQLGPINDVDYEYILSETEKYAQDVAIEIALIESVNILDEKPEEKLSIRSMLDDALSVGLKRDIGHNYNDNAFDRFNFYKDKQEKIPFLIDKLNATTDHGFPRKTLCAVMAGTGIGKSLFLTSMATDYIKQGYNVLYITLEMAEMRIAMRNDANLLDIPIGDFSRKDDKGDYVVTVDDMQDAFAKLQETNNFGKLRIKEYPTGSITPLHIKSLIKELKLKDDFKADVIIIDYINLINSSRMSGKSANSYTIVKAVAEELRGIMVEEDALGLTATQTNRNGISGEEVGIDSVSESS